MLDHKSSNEVKVINLPFLVFLKNKYKQDLCRFYWNLTVFQGICFLDGNSPSEQKLPEHSFFFKLSFISGWCDNCCLPFMDRTRVQGEAAWAEKLPPCSISVRGSAGATPLSFYKNTSLHNCAKGVTQMNSPHYLSGRCTGPQPACLTTFSPVAYSDPPLLAAPLQPSDVHAQNLKREKRKKSRIVHPSSAPERLRARVSAQRTLIAVFPLWGLALLRAGWSQPGTSCRTVQTC